MAGIQNKSKLIYKRSIDIVANVFLINFNLHSVFVVYLSLIMDKADSITSRRKVIKQMHN